MKRRLLRGIKFCKWCGARILFQGYNEDNRFAHLMQQKIICYDCAYWYDLREYPPKYLEVIKGQCFKIYPEGDKKDKSIILGGKGKMRYFMRPDYSVFKSNDIWLIGSVPQRFLGDFPDTAVEITQKAFKQLNRTNRKCKARACLDRYHCWRYNLDLEKNGAFNKVPAKWQIGDEHCAYFLDFKNIYVDDSSVKQQV